MALVACTECGKDISDKALACPGCGAPTWAGLRERAEQDAANIRAEAERDAAARRAQADRDAQAQRDDQREQDAAKARRARRGNVQGCGCLLVLVGGALAWVLIPVGGPLVFVGIVVLVVGLLL